MNRVIDYNYRNEVTRKVWQHVIYNYTDEELKQIGREELAEKLNDDLWADDDVTGNGSGSYFCSREKARECVTCDDNAEDYIREMVADFGMDAKTIADHLFDWEYWDVSIRCYLLGQCIEEALNQIYSAIN